MAGKISKFDIKGKEIVIIINPVTGKTTITAGGKPVNPIPDDPVYLSNFTNKIEDAINELIAPAKEFKESIKSPTTRRCKPNM